MTNYEKNFCQYCGHKLTLKYHERKKRLFCENCELFCWENPIPGTVSIVLSKDHSKILLIKRKVDPQKGMWALPGGFLDKGEDPKEGAIRELKEETGITGLHPELLDTCCQSSNMLGSVLVIAYIFKDYEGEIKAGDDAMQAEFFDINKLPPIAFDSHHNFLDKILKKIKNIS